MIYKLDEAGLKATHGTDWRFRGEETLADLEMLPIQTDAETDKWACRATLRLAERHRLTLYGAAYLELALRRGLPLDRDLRKAAVAENVVLLEE